jgi:hypothetical protein
MLLHVGSTGRSSIFLLFSPDTIPSDEMIPQFNFPPLAQSVDSDTKTIELKVCLGLYIDWLDVREGTQRFLRKRHRVTACK